MTRPRKRISDRLGHKVGHEATDTTHIPDVKDLYFQHKTIMHV